jgi:ferredoxin
MRIRVEIDRTKCVGGGNCVMSAPNVFAQDDRDGLVILLNPSPPETESAAVRQAEELCPGRVISVKVE